MQMGKLRDSVDRVNYFVKASITPTTDIGTPRMQMKQNDDQKGIHAFDSTNWIPTEFFDEIKKKQPKLAAKVEQFIQTHERFYTIYACVRNVIPINLDGYELSPEKLKPRIGICASCVIEKQVLQDDFIGMINFPVSPNMLEKIEKTWKSTFHPVF